MARFKITVAKRAVHPELIDKYINKERYPNGYPACTLFTDGQEFVIEGYPSKPQGFPCDWAWCDIQRDVATVMFGGTPPWLGKPGTAMACCSDGFRPVSFLVERMDD